MMRQNADSVLDRCVDELKSDERTLEACMWSLSRNQSKLATALKTAARINDVRKTFVPDSIRKQSTRERFMAAAEQQWWESGVERKATRKFSREKRQLFNFGKLATQLGAVAVALVVASGASVAMAAESLPGSPLYPIKRASESVRLAITIDKGARGKLLLTIAEERIEELNRIGAKSPHRKALISEVKRDLGAVKQIESDTGVIFIAPVVDEFVEKNTDVLGGTKERVKNSPVKESPASKKSGDLDHKNSLPGNPAVSSKDTGNSNNSSNNINSKNNIGKDNNSSSSVGNDNNNSKSSSSGNGNNGNGNGNGNNGNSAGSDNSSSDRGNRNNSVNSNSDDSSNSGNGNNGNGNGNGNNGNGNGNNGNGNVNNGNGNSNDVEDDDDSSGNGNGNNDDDNENSNSNGNGNNGNGNNGNGNNGNGNNGNGNNGNGNGNNGNGNNDNGNGNSNEDED